MKKFLILLVILLPSTLFAQQKTFMSYYNKYSGQEGFSTVEITSDMIKMMGDMMIENSNDKDLSETLKGIKSIKIVISKLSSDAHTSEINNLVAGTQYKLLSSINKDGNVIKFYFIDGSRQNSDRLSVKGESEFMMTSVSNGNNVVINIIGNLDIKKISQLSNFKIGGMDKLQSVSDR